MFSSFETNRLYLYPTTKLDAHFILELMNSPKFIQFIGDREIRSLESASNYIETKMRPQLERLGFSNYTLVRKSDGQKIGTCGLYDREGLTGIDIGFALLPDYEGQGYGFEAASKILEAGRNNFGLKKIQGITVEQNISSRKLLEKLGLVFEKTVCLPGDDEELFLYSISF